MTVFALARQGETYSTTTDLEVHCCWSCGILYAAPVSFFQNRRTGMGERSWYCPNGHASVFRESDAEKEAKRADAAERRAKMAEDAARYQRQRTETALRSARAYKGQVTKMRNRIAAGVCPVPGCKRSGFSNVMRHIASKHPAWHHEHAEEVRA